MLTARTRPRRPQAARSALSDSLRAASAATLASVVLIASPMAVHAKGGGHGGGGGHGSSHHGSSHHSTSSRRTLRSSRRRTSGPSSSSSSSRSSALVDASPPPPMVLYPDASTARREHGYYCPALPQEGERVDIVGEAKRQAATVISSSPASQASLYGAGAVGELLQPVPGFETDCTITVRYDDGTMSTVSAAEQPRPFVVELSESLGSVLGYGALATLAWWEDSSGWEEAEERQESLKLRLQHASTEAAPRSGEYWGSSEESDEGDQAVRSTITFRGDGTLTGRGRDGVDGAYRLNGRWGTLDGDSHPTVAWIEDYDEGFEVAVEGTFDARKGKINARFTSSRGVSGAFALVLKPSIF